MIGRIHQLVFFVAVVAHGVTAWAQQPLDAPVVETNPAVQAALELPRTEPSHYLSAIFALADLRRAELALPILKELEQLNLGASQRAALVAEFGSHRMLALARIEALEPDGAEFAEACMVAAAAQARDPKRVAQLVDQVADANLVVREQARAGLAAAGDVGVTAVLEALARQPDPQRRQRLMAAAVAMDVEAVGPLLGMLSTTDATLKSEVTRLLEAMQVSQAAPLIAADAARPDAERLLASAIRRYQAGTPAFATDEHGNVVLWQWHDATAKLTPVVLPAGEAQTAWIARLADRLLALRPEHRAYQRQALVLALAAGGEHGSGAIAQLKSAADASLLSTVLADAMEADYSRAAAAAAELLARSEDASVLYASSPRPSPLADALAYPDRRVRFAALGAILSLDPPTPFPGASRVPETLGYFATAAQGRRAVVVMPVADRATTLAGRLTSLGIEADATTRGGLAVQLAGQSADLELLLVDVDVQSPGIRDVLYALRSEAATGQTPIGLLATGERLGTARQLATEHDRVIAFPRPQTDAAVSRIVDELSQLSDRDSTSPAERAEMAGQAVAWLGQLLVREDTFYDLRREAPVIEAALYLPDLSSASAAALAQMGTSSSQRALVGFASRASLPIDARRQAAEAFRASVQRHGILLTGDEILRQYDRYNASETADAATQQVLGSILDTIEALRAEAGTRGHPAAGLAGCRVAVLPGAGSAAGE